MELFKLLGTIAINNSDANSAIDETSSKAKSFSEKLSDGFTTMALLASELLIAIVPSSLKSSI